MSDIFLKEDLHNLLKHKKVIFIGDSNIRSYYKDLLCLYYKSEVIHQRLLKSKMENSVYNDILVSHGKKMNGRDYREERRFKSKPYHFEFYFITRVFDDYVKKVLDKAKFGGQPDVIIMNSCLWDMCRWGPDGVRQYKENVLQLMKYLNANIDEKCLIIWVTTPPLSSNIRGGFLVVQLDFLKYCLRFHVMEANTYCRKVVVAHGYDVLDIHYHLRMQLHRRASDGIHWLPTAVRYITNLLLTHISLSWGVTLPHRYESVVTHRTLAESEAVEENQSNYTQKKSKHDENCEKRKPFHFSAGSSYHAFERNQKLKQSLKRIKGWAHEPSVVQHGEINTAPWLTDYPPISSGGHREPFPFAGQSQNPNFKWF